jgi:hypothetical protein
MGCRLLAHLVVQLQGLLGLLQDLGRKHLAEGSNLVHAPLSLPHLTSQI